MFWPSDETKPRAIADNALRGATVPVKCAGCAWLNVSYCFTLRLAATISVERRTEDSP